MKRVERKYSFSSKKGLPGVSKEVDKILNFLSPRVDDSELFGLRLVLTEIMNNAVIHGNKNEVNTVSGEVTLSTESSDLSIIICDQGEGFEWTRLLMEKNISPNPNETLTEGGRGYMLIRMYGFSYSFNAKGNKVELTKEVKLKDE